MGYEIKLKIGKLLNLPGFENELMEYASLDLCKPGPGAVMDLARRKPRIKKEAVAYYEDSGDERQTEDSYGDAHPAIPLAEMVKALKKDNAQDPYRRFTWALALLESMQATGDDKEVVCVTHGH